MNTNIPKVHIVIPLYNAEAFIADTIQSVLNQSYKNFKLTILDDCSTDQSLSIAQAFNDPRIIIKSHPHRLGFFKNWNAALNEIDTDYGKLLPHDDILYPDCIQKQVDVLENNHEVVLVHCNRNIIDPKGNILTRRIAREPEGKKTFIQSLKKIIRSGTNPIGEPGAVLFRSKSIKSIGSFSEKNMYTIDIEFWTRLLTTGARYTQKEILCSFRVWPGSTSVLLHKKQSQSIKVFLLELANRYPDYITKVDIAVGLICSYVNQILRGIFYLYIKLKSL